MGILVALEQGIPDKFGDRFTGELCPVKRRAEYRLSGFWRADVTAHAYGLIDDVRHPGFKIHPGQDAFGRGISHFNRGNNKIRFVFIFRELHSRTMRNLRGRRTFNNMGFWFYKA